MGICGASMQGLFRNPLADPSIIGISAGASLAAAIMIVLGHKIFANAGIFAQVFSLSIATFLGAILATLVIFSLSVTKGKAMVSSMLLTGIAINAFSMAFVGLLTTISTESQLRTLTFWTLGSLGGANWKGTALMFIIFCIVIFGLLKLYKSLNLLALGENEAKFLGISTESLKRKILIYTALGVGVSVSLCGMISFVGLVVPHLVRLSVGSDNKIVLPLSAIGGALLLCGADLISRIIAPPTEIPIGVITALIGAPFFLILLHQQKKKNISI
jgi:iron complex transport system permease protein